MKSVKAFVIYILLFYLILFLFDWLKATFFAVEYHSFLIWFKTFFLVAGGIAIMFITLDKNFFKTFLAIYLSCWFIYFLLQKFLPYNGMSILNHQYGTNKMLAIFLNATQLYTPLPFLVFWILNRVFFMQEKK